MRQYLPFIKSETAKFLKRIPVEGQDDELGIAMFAFHEAAIAYSRDKGAFLKLASTAIRNRLIDYQRKEQRHTGIISLDQTVDGVGESRTLLEQIDSGYDEISRRQDANAARKEIMEFAQQLSRYGLKLSDIADNCPRQERTLAACHRYCPMQGKTRCSWIISPLPENFLWHHCLPEAVWNGKPWSGTESTL